MIITDQEKHRSTEEAILRTIKTLHDGSVEIVVQDSKVIRVIFENQEGEIKRR